MKFPEKVFDKIEKDCCDGFKCETCLIQQFADKDVRLNCPRGCALLLATRPAYRVLLAYEHRDVVEGSFACCLARMMAHARWWWLFRAARARTSCRL